MNVGRLYILALCIVYCNLVHAQIFDPIKDPNQMDQAFAKDIKNPNIYKIDEGKIWSMIKQRRLFVIPTSSGKLDSFTISANSLTDSRWARDGQFWAWDGYNTHGDRMKLDYSSMGFRAMVVSPEGNYTFVEPYDVEHREIRIVYQSKYSDHHEVFQCHNTHAHNIKSNGSFREKQGLIGESYREFDLAVALTGEYSQYFGGTKAAALSALFTTINRVNSIFEKELSTRFRLIDQQQELIFTDPETDPFIPGTLSDLKDQAHDFITEQIGTEHFDIGHLLTVGNGGMANILGICNSLSKGRGITALQRPEGDLFDIEYLSHELGHQLGALHTFNNCSGLNGGDHAFEPGSGTSIMSYAGLCGSDNVAMNSDHTFHFASLARMEHTGNQCADFESNPISLAAIVTPEYSRPFPISTPFYLMMELETDEQRVSTYSYDQMDAGNTQPYGEPNATGPLFRSRMPTADARRNFPNIQSQLIGSTPSEVLPETSREVHFEAVARQQYGNHTVIQTSPIIIRFTTLAGPLRVVNPNAQNETLLSGDSLWVEWDVAGTHIAPVSCNRMDIFLSTDFGRSFNHVLAAKTPNDGSERVVIPEYISDSCVIKIEAHDHYFYALSSVFKIDSSQESNVNLALEKEFYICADDHEVIADLHTTESKDDLRINIVGLPREVISSHRLVTYAEDSIQWVWNSTGWNLVAAGDYTVRMEVINASEEVLHSSEIEIHKLSSPLTPPVISFPENGLFFNSARIPISWSKPNDPASFQIQISKEPNFTSLIIDRVLRDSSYMFHSKAFGVYYVRVRQLMKCSQSEYSSIASFHTGLSSCVQESMGGSQGVIFPENQYNLSIEESINVEYITLSDIKGTLSSHNGVSFSLRHPDGREKTLMNATCLDDGPFDYSIDDQHGQVFSCPIEGVYQSVEALEDLYDSPSKGDWRLIIRLENERQVGRLDSASLTICGMASDGNLTFDRLESDTMNVEKGQSMVIDSDVFDYQLQNHTTQDYIIKIHNLPRDGILTLNQRVLSSGEWIHSDQIESRSLVYHHGGLFTHPDSMKFSVLFDEIGIIQDQKLFFRITEKEELSLEIEQLKRILCHGDSSGVLKLSAKGGSPPYLYSSQNHASFSDSIYSNLPSGDYQFTVSDVNEDRVSINYHLDEPEQLQMEVIDSFESIMFYGQGGQAPYLFQVNNGPFGPQVQPESLFVGFNSVRIKDANGCILDTTYNLEASYIDIILNEINSVQCFGDRNGSFSCVASGGMPPYMYSLRETGVTQGSGEFSNLPSGSYSLYVKDAQGNADSFQVIIDQPDPIHIEYMVVIDSLSIHASGGTPPYQYSVDGLNYQSVSMFPMERSSLHVFYVKDSRNCEDSIQVLEHPELQADFIIRYDSTCTEEVTARVEISVIGGKPPYHYHLIPGRSQDYGIFDSVQAGEYKARIMDADSHVIILDSILIEYLSPLDFEIRLEDIQADVYPTGGLPSHQLYVNGAKTDSFKFTPVSDLEYLITLRDQRGCEITRDFRAQMEWKSVRAKVKDSIACFNDQNGSVEILTCGGVPPYNYTIDGISWQASKHFYRMQAGTYPIRAKDALGQELSAPSFSLAQPRPLAANIFVHSDSIFVDAFGGSGVIEISIDGAPFSLRQAYESLSYGLHEVVLKDENQCVTSYEIFIQTTSTYTVDRDTLLQIQPNPFRDELLISLPPRLCSKAFSVSIYNFLGQLMYEFPFSSCEIELNTNSWPSGIYLLELSKDNRTQSQHRLIKAE